MVRNVVGRLSVIVDVDDRASARLMQMGAMGEATATQFSTAAAQANVFGAALKGVGIAAAGAAASVGLIAWQGAQLSSRMATIQATTKATEQEMASLREEITRVGSDTPASIMDAADAFKQLSYAGLETNEIMRSGMDVVELAVAGQLEMGEAARIAAQNMNAFNLEAEQMGAVSDTLAAVFATSQTEIQELANGLSYVNATASQLGFSLTETTAALGVLSDNAIAGTRAGTSLNQALSKMFSQTGKAKDALDAVGLSIQNFTDEEGNVKNMTEILQILQGRMDQMSERGRVAFATDLFGRRGARAVLPLVENLDSLQEKQEDVGFAQLKSQLTELEEMGDEEDILAIEDALFGGDADARDVLEGTPDAKTVLEELRKRYGSGDMAASQIQQVLSEAFPEMESKAIEQVAKELAQTEITVSDLADAWEVSDEKAREMAKGMTEAQKAAALVDQQMSQATTDQDIYQEFMATTGGLVEDLVGDLGALAQEMFIGMAPALKEVLEGLKGVTSALYEHRAALQDAGKALLVVAGGLTAATVGLAGLWGYAKLKMFSSMAGGVWQAATASGYLGTALSNLAGSAGLLFSSGDDLLKMFGGLKDLGWIQMSEFALIAKSAFTSLAGGLSIVISNIAGASSVMGALGAAFGGLQAGVSGLLGPLGGLLGVLGPIGWAAAAAAAVFGLWLTDFQGFRSKVKPFTKALGEAADGIMNFAGSALQVATWALGGFYDTAERTGALEAMIDVLAFILNGLGGFIYVIARAGHYLGQFVKIAGEVTWGNLIIGPFEKLGGAIDYAIGGIQSLIDMIPSIPEPPDWMRKILGEGDQQGGQQGGQGGGEQYVQPGDVRGREDVGSPGVNASDARKAGQAQQEAYAKGVQDNRKEPAKATKDSASLVGSLLPRSNADRGPLSDLTGRGAATLKTFSRGMRREQHVVGGAASAAMTRIAKQLGADGIEDLAQDTFKKFEKFVGRTHDPLEFVTESLTTILDQFAELGEALRGLVNVYLNVTNLTGPLSLVREWLGKIVGGLSDVVSWFTSLNMFSLDLSGITGALEGVVEWLDDAISKGEKFARTLTNANSTAQKQDGVGDVPKEEEDQSPGPNDTSGEAPKDGDAPERDPTGDPDSGDPNQPNDTAKDENVWWRQDRPAKKYPGRPDTMLNSPARDKYGIEIKSSDIQKFKSELSTDAINQTRDRYGIAKDEPVPEKVWRKEMRRRLADAESDSDSEDDDSEQRQPGPLGAGMGGAFENVEGPPRPVSPGEGDGEGEQAARKQDGQAARVVEPLTNSLDRATNEFASAAQSMQQAATAMREKASGKDAKKDKSRQRDSQVPSAGALVNAAVRSGENDTSINEEIRKMQDEGLLAPGTRVPKPESEQPDDGSVEYSYTPDDETAGRRGGSSDTPRDRPSGRGGSKARQRRDVLIQDTFIKIADRLDTTAQLMQNAVTAMSAAVQSQAPARAGGAGGQQAPTSRPADMLGQAAHATAPAQPALGGGGMGAGAQPQPQPQGQGQGQTAPSVETSVQAPDQPAPNVEANVTAEGGQQNRRRGQGPNSERMARQMRAQEAAAQRAQRRSQTVMPRAYNAVRSGIIPSFVPTMSDSGTNDGTTGGGGGGSSWDEPIEGPPGLGEDGEGEGEEGDGEGEGEGEDGEQTPEDGESEGTPGDADEGPETPEGEGEDYQPSGDEEEVPGLAEGGVVTDPTAAVVGEGTEDEAVVPLSKLEGMLNTRGGGQPIVIEQNADITIEGGTPDDRQQMYEELRREMDAMADGLEQRLANVLRRDANHGQQRL